MITLAHLRSLSERALTHTENPAIVRLTDRTVEGVARAYMGRGVWITVQGGGYVGFERPIKYHYWHDRPYVDAMLDLTDPGTAHAALVALALALGLDPGPAGLCVAWRPLYATEADGRRRCGWWLSTVDEAVYYVTAADTTGDDDEVVDEAIAAEDDPIKALVAALLHTVEAPDVR